MPTYNPGTPLEPTFEETFQRAARVHSGSSTSTANSGGAVPFVNPPQRNGYVPNSDPYRQRPRNEDPRYPPKDPCYPEDPAYSQREDPRRRPYDSYDQSSEYYQAESNYGESYYQYEQPEDGRELRVQSSRVKPDFKVVMQKFAGGQATNVARGARSSPRAYY